MERPPCKNGAHAFQTDLEYGLRCKECPIELTFVELRNVNYTRNPNPRAMQALIKQKEREWYIKEFES